MAKKRPPTSSYNRYEDTSRAARDASEHLRQADMARDFDPMKHATSRQTSEVLVAYLQAHLLAAGVEVRVLPLIQAIVRSPACLDDVLDELLRRARGGRGIKEFLARATALSADEEVGAARLSRPCRSAPKIATRR